MVAQMVVPLSASFLTTDMTSLAVKESRPLVGSSRNNTMGLVTRAMPMLARFACPPLMPLRKGSPICTSLHVSSPRVLMRLSTAVRFSANDSDRGRFRLAVYISISCTVRLPIRVSNCSTTPVYRCRKGLLGLRPPKRISPSVLPEVLRPDSMSRRVVLPLPEGPSRATSWPALKKPLTSLSRYAVSPFSVLDGTVCVSPLKVTSTPTPTGSFTPAPASRSIAISWD
mmetsp:Transcript_3984/g.8585  ORF Transcript_3984/g.8585 Transcript_3984/m.8585 type:complete len:227 (-) Transcript_3984:161-841(-)